MTGRKNSLSIEEHVALILEADTDIKNGVLLKADRVLSAIEQLGDKHSKELAAKIGMTGASLSKWRGIAESKIIKTNRSGVPYSMTALYMMTLLGKAYENHFGVGQGDTRLQKLIDAGVIGASTGSAVIDALLNRQKALSAQRKQRATAKKLEALTPKKEVKKPKKLVDFIDKGDLFHTIVIRPSKVQLSRWRKADFPVDIGDEYPVHDLRKTTQRGSVICLLVSPRNQVDTGIRCLEGWGFTFRDIIIPQVDVGMAVVVGSRGRVEPIDKRLKTPSLDDVLVFAEAVGKAPRILLGNETRRDGWSVCDA